MQQSVWISYEQCRWAEAAPHWHLEQSAAECYWRGHQWLEKATESVRACRWTTFWTFVVSACDYNKSYGQIKHKYFKKTLLYCWTCDFLGLKVSQGKVRTINRWGGTSNHLSMAYLLSNICTRNYWNQTTVVEIIIGGWVVSFFETQCSKFGLGVFINGVTYAITISWNINRTTYSIKLYCGVIKHWLVNL